MTASVSLQDAGVLALAGVLDYRSGPALREQGRKLIASSSVDPLIVDCAAVEKANSVGVSLLLGFTRDARAAGKALVIRGLPSDMAQIAEVSGISALLVRD
ncbi:MAG: STAS domain-containing protein [Janthinobacterium lividum]|jgi:phospholipid transport system transporter-binding protein